MSPLGVLLAALGRNAFAESVSVPFSPLPGTAVPSGVMPMLFGVADMLLIEASRTKSSSVS